MQRRRRRPTHPRIGAEDLAVFSEKCTPQTHPTAMPKGEQSAVELQQPYVLLIVHPIHSRAAAAAMLSSCAIRCQVVPIHFWRDAF